MRYLKYILLLFIWINLNYSQPDSCTNPLSCDDGDMCTDDICSPEFGCYSIPRQCFDNDHCTINSCDRNFGCIFTPIVNCQSCCPEKCNKGLKCFTSECDPTDANGACILVSKNCTVTNNPCVTAKCGSDGRYCDPAYICT